MADYDTVMDTNFRSTFLMTRAVLPAMTGQNSGHIVNMASIAAKRGKTVILSSHLLSDVEDVCDRVVIYYGGKIQALGTLNELLAKPDTLRITTPVLPRQ